jgi:nitroimidazol reductase NimA-like FMN-containing flavoprotein (pyridoxamine 5'-phosphate oxidase superfamily)
MSNQDTAHDKHPISEQSIATNGEAAVTRWADALAQLEQAHKFWLATVNTDGTPHVMPIFSVWLDGHLYFTAAPASRKAQNIVENPHVVITTTGKTLDLVVEGEAKKITDEDTLKRVAEVYASKYDWHITPHDGAYDAPYGAPAAGLPPYELYQVHITKVITPGGSAEPYGATRWLFS